jgi:cyclomaltodextrinase / maltogenic alpha-amylase / neopullulanase
MNRFILVLIGFSLSLLPYAQSTPQVLNGSEVIYEVNVRQFSKEGTFAELQKALPRLKEMGVDILWLRFQ